MIKSSNAGPPRAGASVHWTSCTGDSYGPVLSNGKKMLLSGFHLASCKNLVLIINILCTQTTLCELHEDCNREFLNVQNALIL